MEQKETPTTSIQYKINKKMIQDINLSIEWEALPSSSKERIIFHCYKGLGTFLNSVA